MNNRNWEHERCFENSMPLYELRNIVHAYKGQTALDIDRMEVPADSVTGILGPNGSGKSTLLSLLGFIQAPTRGNLFFDDQPAEPFAANVRGKVAMLPQEPFLLKRSVFGNIAYGLKIRKTNGSIRRRVHEALELVGLKPDLFSQRPWYALSGGEVRRVALAARLAMQPKVLLLDEPTNSVDGTSAQMIKEAVLHARQQWGTTLVVVSHDMDWLADLCDHTLYLFRGRIVGHAKHTLIYGPWKQSRQGWVARPLDAEQSFMAAPGFENEELHRAVASLPAAKAHLYRAPVDIPQHHHCLKGQLLRLGFERTSQRISAAVQVGSTVLSAYLPSDNHTACQCHPGQTVWIGYDPLSIEWL